VLAICGNIVKDVLSSANELSLKIYVANICIFIEVSPSIVGMMLANSACTLKQV
jgi:hypothetical protein